MKKYKININKSVLENAKINNCHYSTIYRYYKKHNIPLPIKKEYIIHNTKSNKENAILNNCTPSMMTYISKKQNISFKDTRGSKPRITINPFLTNTFNSNYWLGYLLGDGHVGKLIAIHSKDINHLSHYNYFLNNLGYFHYKKDSKVGNIYFSNKEITKELKKVGFKSDKRYYGEYNFKINYEILRGLFDADGYCRNKDNSIRWKITSGNKFIIDKIGEFIKKEGCNFSINRKGKAYDINLLGGKSKVFPFINKLYKEGDYFLLRKFKTLKIAFNPVTYKFIENKWKNLEKVSTPLLF